MRVTGSDKIDKGDKDVEGGKITGYDIALELEEDLLILLESSSDE